MCRELTSKHLSLVHLVRLTDIIVDEVLLVRIYM